MAVANKGHKEEKKLDRVIDKVRGEVANWPQWKLNVRLTQYSNGYLSDSSNTSKKVKK